MKTIALDFETACPQPGNACQIGLAWIEGLEVTRVEERYIRPRDMNFTFTWCHGISEEHVWDQPEFPDVLNEFRADLSGALVLAHNASFDDGKKVTTIGSRVGRSDRMPFRNIRVTDDKSSGLPGSYLNENNLLPENFGIFSFRNR